ncbi:hypothetical protein DERP_008879 [Dermatophagoides pteronyssinus]|uniref:Uncharacterized protein n=1 Tax=Dermatophagoides pteronyssinus TaxID=6956 RepID=A0ABQ8JNZ7_DERPT|nr:hypothetical protein DERP_008879 [Dermatophagoides pteronyssinus]
MEKSLIRLGPSSRQNVTVNVASSSKNSEAKPSHHMLSESYHFVWTRQTSIIVRNYLDGLEYPVDINQIIYQIFDNTLIILTGLHDGLGPPDLPGCCCGGGGCALIGPLKLWFTIGVELRRDHCSSSRLDYKLDYYYNSIFLSKEFTILVNS